MPTRDEICTLCDTYMAAVSSHDLEALMPLFAPDAVQQEPVGAEPNRGLEAIRGFFAASRQVPFTMSRMGPVAVVGNRALFMAHVRVEAPGGVREITTADVITVDEDCRIVELLAFPDPQADPFDSPATRA